MSNHEIKIALWTYCTIFFHYILSEWKIRECFRKKNWIQVLDYFEPNVMVPYPRSKDDERQKGLWKCLGPGNSPPSARLNTVADYFLYFIFYCILVSNAKGNIAKSNKSELWNRLSYRGLPYLFEVRSQTFRNNCKIWGRSLKISTANVILPQRPRKA